MILVGKHFCDFGGKRDLIVFAGKLNFFFARKFNFGEKSRFYDFERKIRFYGFGKKIMFLVLVRGNVLFGFQFNFMISQKK